ncbi:MAG: DNA cytosine methyltransferase [Mesorhizobium sp.]|uniref:DNA cytosine methyltransferase n=1 Tax=Mesorhizobium sp. TaxID=1871066 RepID=UPI000FEAAE45|nr:DNA cytosine methyltransferase [Mesorhizobium sp.]RWC91889.1 MAG: DNA cytosine methyltransferase [Mesorhizobium sp.]
MVYRRNERSGRISRLRRAVDAPASAARFDRTRFRKRWRAEREVISSDNASSDTEISESLLGQVDRRPAFLAVDFFCGAGGTTRGLIDAGGYVVAGIDKEHFCRKTFIENNINKSWDEKPPVYLERDIFPANEAYPAGEHAELQADLDRLIPPFRSTLPGVPLLFAICAPCQPFTTLSRKEMSGARVAKRDKDRNLLKEAARFVERFRPEMVLSENVAGIKDPRYGGIWEEFRSELERLGYATGTRVVCTSRFGVPQYRKRSILIAVLKEKVREEYLSDLLATELLVPDSNPDSPTMTVEEAIGHLPPIIAGQLHGEIPNHRARSLSELNQKRLSCAKPGESNAYMENTAYGDLSLECHRKVNARLNDRCFSDVYTRMRPDRPSPTITTKCHSISNGRFGHYDTDQVRGISLREAATLQSFDDDYVFHPTDMLEPVARMIGNAVPPKLARYFATYLVSSLTSAREPS